MRYRCVKIEPTSPGLPYSTFLSVMTFFWVGFFWVREPVACTFGVEVKCSGDKTQIFSYQSNHGLREPWLPDHRPSSSSYWCPFLLVHDRYGHVVSSCCSHALRDCSCHNTYSVEAEHFRFHDDWSDILDNLCHDHRHQACLSFYYRLGCYWTDHLGGRRGLSY